MAAISSISNCMVLHSVLVLRQWRKPPRISAAYMVIQSMLAWNLLAGVSRNSQLWGMRYMQQETLPHGANGGERTADAQKLLSMQPLQLSSQAGELHDQWREALLWTSLQAIFHSQRQLRRGLWSWKMVQVRIARLPGKQRGVHKWRPGSHGHPRPTSDSVVAATRDHSFSATTCASSLLPPLHSALAFFLALYTQHAQCKILCVQHVLSRYVLIPPPPSSAVFFFLPMREIVMKTLWCHIGQPLDSIRSPWWR